MLLGRCRGAESSGRPRPCGERGGGGGGGYRPERERIVLQEHPGAHLARKPQAEAGGELIGVDRGR